MSTHFETMTFSSQADPTIKDKTKAEALTLRAGDPQNVNYALWDGKTILDLTNYPE